MTDRELMQQALEALKAMQSYAAAERKGLRICDEVIAALRERLAQPEQEPVAYGYRDARGNIRPLNHYETKMNRIPLYTAPPQRKPLTDEEIGTVLGFGEYTTDSTKTTLIHTARAIERAHDIGEKE